MPKLKRRCISQRNAEMSRRMRERRTNDEFRLLDNRSRANSQKIARQNDEFKIEDNKRRAEAHKIKRQNDEFKTKENKTKAEGLKFKHEGEGYKEEERRRNALRMQKNRDKYKNNFDSMKSNYESKIKEGPTHICSCCGGLWFEYSIREFTAEMLTNRGVNLHFIYFKFKFLQISI